jgi:hypothetical protein
VKPTPRWGAMPWFVLVLTLLMILLVVVLPPLVLDKTPPPWVMYQAAKLARYRGDPAPISADWLKTTRAEAAKLMEERADQARPSPSASGATPGASPSSAPPASPSPVDQPGREVYVVVMRGRFDSAASGDQPPADAPERWLVVAYDALSHKRWRTVVLDAAPVLPEGAASFEFE